MGKLLLVIVMIAAVTISCVNTVQTSREDYMMGGTQAEAFEEREETREYALEEQREEGTLEEHQEWRDWDNEWINEFRIKFGAAAADVQPVDLDTPEQK